MTIYITDTIGWPINAADIKEQLAKVKEGEAVSVFISSLGGDVSEALKIRQLLKSYDTTAYIYGITASAATLIATGCRRCIMDPAALYMLHRCSCYSETYGQMNAEELEAAIARLEQTRTALEEIDNLCANIYAEQTGHPVEEMAGLMHAETWLDSDRAKELGFVEEVESFYIDATASLRTRIAACGLPAAPGSAGASPASESAPAPGNTAASPASESAPAPGNTATSPASVSAPAPGNTATSPASESAPAPGSAGASPASESAPAPSFWERLRQTLYEALTSLLPSTQEAVGEQQPLSPLPPSPLEGEEGLDTTAAASPENAGEAPALPGAAALPGGDPTADGDDTVAPEAFAPAAADDRTAAKYKAAFDAVRLFG